MLQITQKVDNYHRANSLYREGGEDSDWVAIDTGFPPDHTVFLSTGLLRTDVHYLHTCSRKLCRMTMLTCRSDCGPCDDEGGKGPVQPGGTMG